MPIDTGIKYLPCPKCGAQAKRLPKFSLIGVILNRRNRPRNIFKCKQCGHEFSVMF